MKRRHLIKAQHKRDLCDAQRRIFQMCQRQIVPNVINDLRKPRSSIQQPPLERTRAGSKLSCQLIQRRCSFREGLRHRAPNIREQGITFPSSDRCCTLTE